MVYSGGADCHKCKKPTFPITDDDQNERSVTDKTCCLLLIVTVAIMGSTYAWSVFNGDTRRLTHGFDHQGRLCGIDKGVESRPFLYYCGSNEWDGAFPKRLVFQSKSCVEACPTNATQFVPCLTHAFVNFTELGRAPETVGGTQVTFVSTLNMDVTQSITLQKGYPSEAYRGKYCVPVHGNSTTGDNLRSELQNGPLKHVMRFNAAVGSFRHAWWLILISALVAVALGLTYLYVLQKYAGILIYISLWVGTVLMFFLGLFCLFGIFPDPSDAEGWYQNHSPIFRMFDGGKARAWSACAALIFCASGVCMLFNTLNQDIDSSIGVIQAATHAMFSSPVFLLQPILGGVIMIALVGLLFWGYMLATTVQHLDSSLVIINGSILDANKNPIGGLQKEWLSDWWWGHLLTFYQFGCLWLVLLTLAITHFVVSFAICDYYFAPGTLEESEAHKTFKGAMGSAIKNASHGKGKHIDGVRVHGLDRVKGGRSGYVEKGPYGKVLVVPVGQPGPDGRDFIRQDEHELVKNMPFDTICKSLTAAFTCHLGSIAMGAWVVTITSPLRLLSMIIKAFTHSEEHAFFGEHEDKPPGGILMDGLNLMCHFLDEFIGCYSKNLYSEIVLTSQDFWEASIKSHDFVAETGGAVALLHGGTTLYEMIGVVVITAVCSLMTFLSLTQIEHFAANDDIDVPMMTMMATAIAVLISTGFMSLFNMTCDTLLYVFAWSRKSEHHGCLRELCPTPLTHLVEGELEDEPAEALKPHARNRMTRYSHAATKYKATVMETMRTGFGAMTEKRPLLGSLRG